MIEGLEALLNAAIQSTSLAAYLDVPSVRIGIPAPKVQRQLTLDSWYSTTPRAKSQYREALRVRVKLWHGTGQDDIVEADNKARELSAWLHNKLLTDNTLVQVVGREPVGDKEGGLTHVQIQLDAQR